MFEEEKEKNTKRGRFSRLLLHSKKGRENRPIVIKQKQKARWTVLALAPGALPGRVHEGYLRQNSPAIRQRISTH